MLEKKWGHFCSKKCYGNFKKENYHLFESNTKSMHTKEVHEKISKVKKHNASKPDYVIVGPVENTQKKQNKNGHEKEIAHKGNKATSYIFSGF